MTRTDDLGSWSVRLSAILIALSLCLSCAEAAQDVDLRQVDVKIDKVVTIIPRDSTYHINAVRHPDGTIYCSRLPGSQEKNRKSLIARKQLFKSTDEGQTWTSMPLNLPPDVPPHQFLQGLGASRDGRLWLLYQSKPEEIFASYSADGGRTWKTTEIDFGKFAPDPQRPYDGCYNDYNTFIERPDGTIMTSIGVRYMPWYWKDPRNLDPASGLTRPDAEVGGEIMIRSTDGGKTWGDPTLVHPYVTEVSYAVDPKNADHILAMTRTQRPLLAGEDRKATIAKTGCPPDTPSNATWIYKNGILLESTDGGRTFHELPGGLTPYYGHRGNILWTKKNLVVVTRSKGFEGYPYGHMIVQLSFNGGKTWCDGTRKGTPFLNQAKTFLVHQGFSGSGPTVELSGNRFLTVIGDRTDENKTKAIIWHITGIGKAAASAKASAAGPLSIEHNKQLFIDDYIIESLDGASKKLNQPTKYAGNPVLPAVPAGAPRWDADMDIYFPSVIFDEEENIFKMWYGLWERGQGDEAAPLAYAISKDGITWRKPNLGMIRYRDTMKNNVIKARNGLVTTVFKDSHETDPAKRYKMFFDGHGYNVCAAYSADGLRWVNYNNGRPVISRSPAFDSHMVCYWDEGLGKYVAIVRDRTGMIKDVRKGLVTNLEARKVYQRLYGGPNRDRKPENHTIRRVGQAESEDFVSWSKLRVIVGPDEKDPLNYDQLYNMEVMQYEGIRVGLMTVFSPDTNRPLGPVQLTFSRDGMNWQRAGERKVFLPLSDRPGDFDWGMIYPAQAPIVVGDEIYIYFTAMGHDHNHILPDGIKKLKVGVGLAKLRLDGFVSVDAGPSEGTLTTKAFVFNGQKLLINADAKRGRVLVEILDETGKPISGFSKADCDALNADKIRHTLSWQGKADLKALEGKAVRLKFYLTRAKLFSFKFID